MMTSATDLEARTREDSPASAEATPTDAQPSPKRIVICLDGTWNNPATEKERDSGDKVFKPTNVLKTCRAIKALDDAAATLVFTGQPLDGETVTIDGKTYTFQDELTDQDGHVQIGDEARKSLENLRFAINRQSGRRRYADATTRHPTVSARAVPGDRYSIEVVARSDGSEGDPFAVAGTLTRGTWAGKAELAEEFRRRGRDPRLGIPQITYYDLGVGALRKFPGGWNAVHRTIDKLFGGAAGAGFEGNVEDAYTFLALNYQEGDEIFIFGFSRGAASARGLARFIDWMGGILPPRDAYWIPRYFDAFIHGESFEATRGAIRAERVARRIASGATPEEAEQAADAIVGTITSARVRFLGVWDTVLALGSPRRERPFVGPSPPSLVDHARQALAIDERRAPFRPRIWERRSPDNVDQTLEQRWFAGVHTNAGGGYVNDGLANLALEWLLGEARTAGLGLDWQFLRSYPGYPQDQLYNSMKAHYRILQTVTFRRNKGIRRIEASEEAGLALHPSVLVRLASPRQEPSGRVHDKLVSYRPKNLLRYLASLPDLDGYIASVEGLPAEFALPDEVRQAIENAG